MPEQPSRESTAASCAKTSDADGLTQTYLPAFADDADVSASERETRLRLTDGGNPPTAPSTQDDAVAYAGRYAIVREVGRGGMGVVLEADDPDLGRHLAIKVLLEQHQHDAGLVRRFLDEARICGQLQHPGIVPVHEIGWLPDRRPFFTMKLIQGQTLASLLQARTHPADDLPRFLAVFEQVCLTMAYAHAHRIIHRDLKPSNIMVGSFGEVQVMDWGLAKVLNPVGPAFQPDTRIESQAKKPDPHGDAATSLAGTVVGTPGFMAPEQARGDSEAIDARCDVFGLGAILCVILTGKPPYDGATHPQVYRQAVEADLRDAYARLDRCAADAELVQVARRCLAANPSERPSDAGIVALAITEYRASVAERLHEAEMERAAAEAKARGERKARRLTLALATATLALLCLGIGAWFWLDHERRQKQELRVRGIEDHLQLALRLRDQGKAAPLGELHLWTEALANLQAAKAELQGDSPDVALRQRLDEASAALETELRDRRMLARLETIRLNKSQAKTFAFRESALEYAWAFRDYGIAVERLSKEEAARDIRNRAIAAELAAALDDWAEACADEAVRQRLLETARQADDDPWRQRLRTAILQHDRDTLADAAQAPEVDHLPPTTLHLLGQALANAGDNVESIRLLRRAQRLHPDDFWINFRLALHLELNKPSQPVEAVRFYTAALALRKQSAATHLSLGVALHDSQALDEAIAEYREALRLQNDFPLAHYNLGNALKDKKQYDDALAEYREAIRLKPDYVEAHNNMGSSLADLGRVEEACAAFQNAIRIKAHHASAHHNLALALMRLGRIEEALDACRQAVHFEGNAGYYNTLGLIWEKKKQATEAVAAYKKAIELDKDFALPHYNLGLLYLHLGETKKGEAEIQESLRLRPKDAVALYNLGTTLIQQGQSERAVAVLRKAVEINPKYVKAWSNLGTALCDLGQLDAGIAAYREALRVDPKFLDAWTSLGATYQQKGDYNSAIDALRQGVAVAKDNASAHNNLGRALAQRGRLAEAVSCFREAIRLQPDFAQAYNNLGNALGAQGELQEAIEAYEKSIALKPDYKMALWNRGQILKDWGKLDEAIAVYRNALALDSDDAWGNCLLGLALLERGKLKAARDALKRGHELGVRQKGWNRPSEQWLSNCVRLIEREKKLPALRHGEYKPADDDERIALATLCLQAHPYYAEAVELYRAAFANKPALTETHRYNAACAAVLAGFGKGEKIDDITEAKYADWRKQALAWLRADLERLRMRSERGSEGLRGSVRTTLRRWQSDAALAAVRDAKALAALPKEESEAWRTFWDEVDEVMEATTPKKMVADAGVR